MSIDPFRIRLPKRDAIDQTIAEFPLCKSTDITSLTRRAKRLAALGFVDQKTRNRFARSLSTVCKIFLQSNLENKVRFRIVEANGEPMIWADVVALGCGRISQLDGLTQQLDAMRKSLTHVELDENGGAVCCSLAQATPRTFRPNAQQLWGWSELLRAPTSEDAIAIAQYGRQQCDVALETVRLHSADRESAQRAEADRADLETLSLVVRHTPIAIMIMDDQGTVQWANPAFKSLTGYSIDEAVGSTFDALAFGPSTSSVAVRDYYQAFSNGYEYAKDIMLYRNDGQTVWVECHLIPVPDSTGRNTRWIGILGDVTKRRRAEDALRAAKKSAEASSRTKSEFLANMSHEIRTPLNAILGMTELALTTSLDSEQRDYLKTVQTSADTLLQLLNDVLDISKIEAGKMEIEEVDFNLPDVVRETLKALAVRAHQKGLELAVHMPMDLPQFLKADPVRIRQVLFNLVGNAIKFTDSGEVVVEIEEQWRSGDEVSMHFSVRDTGIGIPAQKLRKIFESFTQVDSSMARRFGGSGLGLTISSQLVRLMNGKIWVQSEQGVGSTFHFTIQAKIGHAPEAPPQIPDSASLENKTALVVDDNATNRRILDEMLKHWGLQPTLCENADSALRELERATAEDCPFDVVLLDAMMPDVDGFQLAERIQRRNDLACGTVMMLSSADRPTSASRCRQLGIHTYLVKPVSASTLLETILEAIARNTGQTSRDTGDLADPTSANLTGAAATRRSWDNEPTQLFKPDRTLRVLVVDDHEANRKLAIKILSRRGHRCVAAGDGNEAVAAVAQRKFDAVLMDVQMPVCDGFTATKKIREREREIGQHVPIIALTAHALAGDREKCLNAGMDAYLSKPIHAGDLITLVERMTGVAPTGEVEQPEHHGSRPVPSANFDISAALQRMGGERDLLIEHIGYVLNDAPELLRQMATAIENNQGNSLAIAAHRLKSLVSSYDHTTAVELTVQLEQMGRDDELERAPEKLEPLKTLVNELNAALRQYRDQQLL